MPVRRRKAYAGARLSWLIMPVARAAHCCLHTLAALPPWPYHNALSCVSHVARPEPHTRAKHEAAALRCRGCRNALLPLPRVMVLEPGLAFAQCRHLHCACELARASHPPSTPSCTTRSTPDASLPARCRLHAPSHIGSAYSSHPPSTPSCMTRSTPDASLPAR